MQKLVLILILFVVSNAQSTECQKYILKLIKDLQDFNIADLPLPSIMYSGITTNNPGQMQECQNSNYSYYLVHIKNNQTFSYTYTGLCVPEQCSAEDVEVALEQFIHCTVYSYPIPRDIDPLAIIGLVIISLWLIILITWSCVISFKEPVINQYLKNQNQRSSINADSSQPLLQSSHEADSDYKIFNYYEGYLKIFKVPSKKSIFSPIFFLAVLGYVVSVQFSYKQTIAENQNNTAPQLLESFNGMVICNTQIVLQLIIFIFGLRLAYGTYKIKTFRGIGRYFFDQLLKKWILLILISFLIYSFMTIFVNQPLSKIWNLNNGQDCPKYMWQMWFLFRNLQLDCKTCLPWLSLMATEILFTLISAPFLMIFRFSKKIGYGLLQLLIITSAIISYAILQSQNIIYEPTKLMNAQKQFVIDYQGNSFVRMSAFFMGLMLGLIIIEGLEKSSEQKTGEYSIAKKIKQSNSLQIILQVLGSVLMILAYLLIIPFLGTSTFDASTYLYIILTPLLFLLGLSIFVLPSFWQGSAASTVLTNRILGWSAWVYLDRISTVFYMIAPMVIGFTTYSMQSSIYYDYLTITTYLLGDLFLAYVLSLVITAAFDNQLVPIVSWLQVKIFGNQSKYSVLVIQE